MTLKQGVSELTVIIVSYNTRDLTLSALRTLYAETLDTKMDVVVIDNASQDGSADAVAEAFPQVSLVRSDDNLGFAKANNVIAETAKTEWLLLLNPDTEVHDRAVDRLMDFAKAHPENGIYGGRTVFPDGSLNAASCWMQISLWSLFCSAFGLTALFPRSNLFHPEGIGGWRRDSVREVDIVVGCFLLIPRALWNELGGFDLRYFMYGEEADLCLRARAKGWRPIISPDAEIMHLVGASSKTQGRKRIQVAKARATLVRDHWPAWKVPFGIALIWIWAALRRAGYAFLGPVLGKKQTAEAWAEVWRERRAWLAGY